MDKIIEELYKTFDVPKVRWCETFDECPNCLSHQCVDCDVQSKLVYPDFTYKKQMKLLEFLAITEDGFEVFPVEYEKEGLCFCIQVGNRNGLTDKTNKRLDYALAQLLCELIVTYDDNLIKQVQDILGDN